MNKAKVANTLDEALRRIHDEGNCPIETAKAAMGYMIGVIANIGGIKVAIDATDELSESLAEVMPNPEVCAKCSSRSVSSKH